MNSKINNYELSFIRYYSNKYKAAYIKVRHNKGLVPTKVTLYNSNKRVIKHKPTYYGVTVKNMFAWLEENKFYAIDEFFKEGK